MYNLNLLFDKAGREFDIGFISSNAAIAIEIYKKDKNKFDSKLKSYVKKAISLIESIIQGYGIINENQALERHEFRSITAYNRILNTLSNLDDNITASKIKEKAENIINVLNKILNNELLDTNTLDNTKELFKKLTKNSINQTKILLDYLNKMDQKI